jgi:DNA-binding transcriptional regulator GbsR (MarR family)
MSMTPNAQVKIAPEIEELANQIGEFIQYWGFKKVHGRIWAHLYLTETPLDAADVMARLAISKALASMSLNDLLSYDVIQVVGRSDKGTTLYLANPNITSVILGVLRKRERKMLSHIWAAYKVLRDSSREERKTVTVDQKNLKQMGELIRTAEQALEGLLAMETVDFGKWTEFDSESRDKA